MIETAFLLAAGRGERMRPLSDRIHKCLLPLKKKPLIIYLIEAFKRANIRHFVINIAYKAEQIQDVLKDGQQWGVCIDYAYEKEALETGGGIVHALPLIKSEWFWAVSSDIYTDYAFSNRLPYCLRKSNKVGHLVLIPEPVLPLKGDFDVDAQQCVLASPVHTYGNMGIFSKAFFKKVPLEKFKLANLLYKHVAKQALTGEIYRGVWHNIGTVQDYNKLLNI